MDNKEIENTSEARQATRRHSAAERAEILKQWEASGLSAEAFAESRPFNVQSLYRWRMMEKSANREPGPLGKQGFREFKLAAPFADRTAGPMITVETQAFQVSIAGYPIDDRLAAFVKELGREVSNV